MRKTFKQLIAEALADIPELFPWDLSDMLEQGEPPLLLDIREQDEYSQAHIKGSLHVPRGVLEAACEWDYSDTQPELVRARDKPVVVICRSGNRSALAAYTMKQMGYQIIYSLRTGVKGWNDSDFPLFDEQGNEIDADWADGIFNPPLNNEQLSSSA